MSVVLHSVLHGCAGHVWQVSENRIIIGFRSNDGWFPREPPPEELWPPNAGEFVRATLLKGGYDVQVLDDGSIQISFLIQVRAGDCASVYVERMSGSCSCVF